MQIRSLLPLCLLILIMITAAGFRSFYSQNPLGKTDKLTGAWQLQNGNEVQVLLFMNDYVTHTSYDKTNKQFFQTNGGFYKTDNNQLTVQYEFDTKNTERINESVRYNFSIDNDQLSTNINGQKMTWQRVDDGSKPLAGVWHITQRMQDEKLVPIHRTGTRKTLKILTGNRFQWVAIDPGKKEFSGTGGGNYTFENGTYTENIEFFSRDSSRVGASLSFNGKLEGKDWHHSGLSSKGDKIYEVWSKVKE